MHIKKILRYDREAKEADILISNGTFELLCYAMPYQTEDFNKSNNLLYAFMTENVMRATENSYKVKKLQNGYYSYHLQGKIIRLQKPLVTIGNILLEIDGVIPQDIKEGEFIEFTVMRIDW